MESHISHFLQNQIDEFQAEVTMAGYSEMEQGITDRSCDQQLYRFIYLDKGRAAVKVGDSCYDARAGQLFLVPAGVQFTIRIKEDAVSCYYCHFLSASLELPFIDSMDFPFKVKVASKDSVKQLYRKMIAEHNASSVTRKLKLRSALLELFATYVDASLSELPSASMPADMNWDEVLAYIDRHLDRNITVEELAKVTHLHPNYFITLFKTAMGCSPIQFVTRRRIVTAKQLLTDTGLSVTQISEKVGMLNHYLSRQFKRITGLTPVQYRKFAQLGAQHVLDRDQNKTANIN